jgi:hypothetical protein
MPPHRVDAEVVVTPDQPHQNIAGENGHGGERTRDRAKAARNQLVFREVNERIAELNIELAAREQDRLGLFICECSDTGCAEGLEMTVEEYEAVRANGARFVVLSGHQLPELERIVDGNERFLVVEKVDDAAAIAHGGNPRA